MKIMRTALILIGGRATRAEGKAKHLFTYEGESFIRRQIRTLEPIVDEIILVGREEDPGDLPVQEPFIRYTYDIRKGEGPAGGIHAGALLAKGEYIFVTAGDMPFLSGPVISRLFDLAVGSDGAVPIRSNGYTEPLHSVYRKEAVQNYFSQHQTRQLIELINAIQCRFVQVDDLRDLDPALQTFCNVNDLATLEEIQKKDEIRL